MMQGGTLESIQSIAEEFLETIAEKIELEGK
jgi:hypothetical protein